MLPLAGLSFVTPWLLGALAAVPVLWWLLRVMPPRPKSVKFPAFFLLKDLHTDVKTAVHTPWWLLLLRALIVVFFIFALADPVMKRAEALPGSGGAVLIAVDNGWSAAAHWQERQAKLKEVLLQVQRSKRNVIFLPTAADPQDGKLHLYGPMAINDAQEFADHLQPRPWPMSQKDAAALAVEAQGKNVSYAVYFSDGTAESRAEGAALTEALQRLQGLTFVSDDKINTPVILRKTSARPGLLDFKLETLTAEMQSRSFTLAAYGEGGNILDTLAVTMPAGAASTDVEWKLMEELRDKVAKVALQAPQTASTVYLTDSQWRQHPVGIISDPAGKDNESFLNEVYYLRRALEVNGALDVDTVDTLLQKQLSAIIWPDSAPLSAVERVDLGNWVHQGGFLIRFAGPNLAANTEDPLLPVPLRYGQRALEGAMTWEKPLKLGATREGSPLAGIDIPADVTVTRQVLANPTPEVFEKTWLQLEDGTPLITGGPIGKGVVVLVHTAAGPDWSNFGYSGLFVEALQRMIALSTGISDYKADAVQAPYMVMDGFGRLQSPGDKSIIAAIDPRQPFTPSAMTPPGLYGSDRMFQVYNLGEALPKMIAMPAPGAGVETAGYGLSGERSLKSQLLQAAFWLLLLDTFLTLWLRGAFARPARAGAAAGLAVLLLLQTAPAFAQTGFIDPMDLTSNIYLAYIQTGDRDVDEVSYNGLSALADVTSARTTVKVKGVRGVNPATDDLYYYPFLYWPMTNAEQDLSPAAARNLQNYLAQGGMILFDTRDQQFANGEGEINGATIGTVKLRHLTESIRIPELMTVSTGHILTKSFYLLDDFPGLYDGGKLWVEKEPSANFDAVTSVVIGDNDWAAAWSNDATDRARFTVSPGGEQQREMAYRFGVNLIMAALAGNYKADQVHVPYILERLGK